MYVYIYMCVYLYIYIYTFAPPLQTSLLIKLLIDSPISVHAMCLSLLFMQWTLFRICWPQTPMLQYQNEAQQATRSPLNSTRPNAMQRHPVSLPRRA